MTHASVHDHSLEVRRIPEPRRGRGSRATCGCCGSIVTHELFANGVNMGWAGCEMEVWRSRRTLERQRGFR
jgi:hypothetical protein